MAGEVLGDRGKVWIWPMGGEDLGVSGGDRAASLALQGTGHHGSAAALLAVSDDGVHKVNQFVGKPHSDLLAHTTMVPKWDGVTPALLHGRTPRRRSECDASRSPDESLGPATGRSESGVRSSAVIGVQRDTLAVMLRSHGEDDLADRTESFSDDQLARIGRLGAYYAWSDEAIALGGSMGGARALSLAAIDVIEGTERELRRHHTEAEIAHGLSDRPTPDERAADHALRRHAAEKQQPPDGA